MMNTTQTKAQPKPRLAVLIESPKLDRSYGNQGDFWNLSIVSIDPSDEKPRNCSRTAFPATGAEIFDDLVLRCHFSWYDGKFQVGGMYVEYLHVYSVDLNTLAILTRGLKRCQKISESFPVRPDTFGQYVCLMAAGLGVKECVRRRGERSGSFYSDSDWQVLPISAAQRIIDEELDKVREQVCPTPAVSAA